SATARATRAVTAAGVRRLRGRRVARGEPMSREVLSVMPPMVADRATRRGSAAGRAEAEDLDGVVDLAEAVLGGRPLRPRLDGGALDLLDPAAGPAHQVVVVPGAAPAVEQLAVLVAQGVELVLVGEDLQVAVDGGQADRLPPGAQL